MATLTQSRAPYTGLHRKLILAFDVGTTFSGISYSILDPGEVPEIRGVNRFPAQEHVGGDSKIPTILYYDKEGKVRAAGAEALRDGVEDEAEEEGWVKAEWFKLHLRPKTRSGAHITTTLPPLPGSKTAVEVLADYLAYLSSCARKYISETHASGAELLKSLEGTTEYVLTHPNGWEGAQQSLMRKAAVMANLIPDTREGQARVSFVTEGEASLHFCVRSGLTSGTIKEGKGVLIVDAGGGTIDISAYRQVSETVRSFEEVAAPQCHFHGSIFVTNRAGQHLQDLLKGSKFTGDIPYIIKCFDKATKLRFRSADEPQYIKFGSIRDKDPKLNIRSGQLRLAGTDVAKFFEPSVQCIVKAIEEQCRAADGSRGNIGAVFLVGGFAASEYLYSKLKATFAPRGLDVSRPDSHVNKAVADGAISFYLDHFVAARVAKFAYGVEISRRFQSWNPEHVKRNGQTYLSVTGHRMVEGIFDTILPKDTKVSETQEFRQTYKLDSSDKRYLNTVRTPILCYRGTSPTPEWMDSEPSMYSTLCHVQADMAMLSSSLKSQTSELGKAFYGICFDVVLSLGLTELKANIVWEENGVVKKSPAEIVYDPDVVRDD